METSVNHIGEMTADAGKWLANIWKHFDVLDRSGFGALEPRLSGKFMATIKWNHGAMKRRRGDRWRKRPTSVCGTPESARNRNAAGISNGGVERRVERKGSSDEENDVSGTRARVYSSIFRCAISPTFPSGRRNRKPHKDTPRVVRFSTFCGHQLVR